MQGKTDYYDYKNRGLILKTTIVYCKNYETQRRDSLK